MEFNIVRIIKWVSWAEMGVSLQSSPIEKIQMSWFNLHKEYLEQLHATLAECQSKHPVRTKLGFHKWFSCGPTVAYRCYVRNRGHVKPIVTSVLFFSLIPPVSFYQMADNRRFNKTQKNFSYVKIYCCKWMCCYRIMSHGLWYIL